MSTRQDVAGAFKARTGPDPVDLPVRPHLSRKSRGWPKIGDSFGDSPAFTGLSDWLRIRL